MTQFFDDRLLAAFMGNFYGYGNYQGPYWFIGMEEGGGDSFAEVSKRLAIWDQRGRGELEDVVDYHLALGIDYPFVDHPKLQPTWAKLIRVLLSMEGQPPTKDEVRRFQQSSWARSSGNVCLMELLPLPSPSTSHWLYGQHSKLPALADRASYREHWSPLRVQALRQRIAAYKPRVVVFYGFSYSEYWRAIAGGELQPALAGDLLVRRDAEQLYGVMKHPAATGVTSEYFHEAGLFLRRALKGEIVV